MMNGSKWYSGKEPGGTILDYMIREEVAFSDSSVCLANKQDTVPFVHLKT